MRFFDGQTKIIHDNFDAVLVHLGEDDVVDLLEVKAAIGSALTHTRRPAQVVDRGREGSDQLDLGAASFNAFNCGRFVGAAGVDAPVFMIGTICFD